MSHRICFSCSGCLDFRTPTTTHPPNLPVTFTTPSCLSRIQLMYCIFTQSHYHRLFKNSPCVLGNDASFHHISTDLVLVCSALLSWLLFSSIKKNSAFSLPPFFFSPLIRARLNKEKRKGKGKICFSVSALPSVSASTSWADRQAGRGRALWSDFP